MKKKWSFILCVCFFLKSSAQTNSINPLLIKDSLLSNYLTNALDTIVTGDSCFSGIYYIKFSLTKDGNLSDFYSSELMPVNYKTIVKKRLEELNKKWSPLFLKFAGKKNKVIIQPIFIEVINQCPMRENFYSKKLEMDSTGTMTFSYNLAQTTLILFGNMLTTTKETFKKASRFDSGNNEYIDCLLLPPCIVSQKKKRSYGNKFD